MPRIITYFTRLVAIASAPHQQAACAESDELMRRTDAIKSAHFDKLRAQMDEALGGAV